MEKDNDAFVLLSEVHLDDAAVVSKLQILFEGFEDFPPPLFILCGNFTSRRVGLGADSYSIQDLSEYFDGKNYPEC